MSSLKNSLENAVVVWFFVAMTVMFSGCDQTEITGTDIPVSNGIAVPVATQEPTSSPSPAVEPVVDSDPVPEIVNIKAVSYNEKPYSEDGIHELTGSVTVTLPKYVSVLEGVVRGKDRAHLYLAGLDCRYRGKILKQRIENSRKKIKIYRYVFHVCLNEKGKSVDLDDGFALSTDGMIRLSLDNKGTKEGITVAGVEITIKK